MSCPAATIYFSPLDAYRESEQLSQGSPPHREPYFADWLQSLYLCKMHLFSFISNYDILIFDKVQVWLVTSKCCWCCWCCRCCYITDNRRSGQPGLSVGPGHVKHQEEVELKVEFYRFQLVNFLSGFHN